MFVFFFEAEDGIRDYDVTGVQTCALPISLAGVILCDAGGSLSGADRANLGHLCDELGPLLVGEIPHLVEGGALDKDVLAIDTLLRTLVD